MQVDPGRMSDLVRSLRKGDVSAFDQIYNKYNRKIYAVSLRYLRSREDAEEVVQEVFLNLWRKRDELKDQHNFNAYLFTITHNIIRNKFRKLSREKKYTEDYLRSLSLDDDSTNTEIEYANLLDLAERTINDLPDRQKTVYHLSIRDGLSSREISDRLGISKRTVESHLQKARAFLKKALSDNRLISILYIGLFIY